MDGLFQRQIILCIQHALKNASNSEAEINKGNVLPLKNGKKQYFIFFCYLLILAA